MSKQGGMPGLARTCEICGDRLEAAYVYLHMMGHFLSDHRSVYPSSLFGTKNNKHGLIHNFKCGVLFSALAPPMVNNESVGCVGGVGVLFDGIENECFDGSDSRTRKISGEGYLWHFQMLEHFDRSVFNKNNNNEHHFISGVLFSTLSPPTPINNETAKRNESAKSVGGVGVLFNGMKKGVGVLLNGMGNESGSDCSGHTATSGYYSSLIADMGPKFPGQYFSPYRGGLSMYEPTGYEFLDYIVEEEEEVVEVEEEEEVVEVEVDLSLYEPTENELLYNIEAEEEEVHQVDEDEVDLSMFEAFM